MTFTAKCPKCGYSWESEAKGDRTTCSKCKHQGNLDKFRVSPEVGKTEAPSFAPTPPPAPPPKPDTSDAEKKELASLKSLPWYKQRDEKVKARISELEGKAKASVVPTPKDWQKEKEASDLKSLREKEGAEKGASSGVVKANIGMLVLALVHKLLGKLLVDDVNAITWSDEERLQLSAAFQETGWGTLKDPKQTIVLIEALVIGGFLVSNLDKMWVRYQSWRKKEDERKKAEEEEARKKPIAVVLTGGTT